MSQIINRILPTKKIKEGLKWTNIKLQNQLHFSISIIAVADLYFCGYKSVF